MALLDYEMTKQRLAEIRKVLSKPSVDKKKTRGKKRKHMATREEIAEETGISTAAQVTLERHEALAEQYHFLQGSAWAQ